MLPVKAEFNAILRMLSKSENAERRKIHVRICKFHSCHKHTPCVSLWIIIYLLPMVIYQFYMACEWQKAKAMTYFQATENPLNLDGKSKLENFWANKDY